MSTTDFDKIKQVIVVRKDLGMRQGKAIAQGGHAVAEVFWSMMEQKKTIEQLVNLSTWRSQGGQAKITVRVESLDELEAVAAKAREAGLEVHEVVDSGLTEFGGIPTKTCISVGPDRSSKIDPVTGHLKLL